MNACPSHFALDDRELHGSADVDRHIEGCPRCQGRLVERAAAASQFQQALAAPVWRGAIARRDEVARRRFRSRLRLWLVPVLAAGGAVASLALVRSSPSPSVLPSSLPLGAAPGYVAPKGRAPVAIACRRGDRTFFLAPNDDVAPGDELRFRPLPVWPDARFIQIGSVDGTGGYAPFYPLAGGSGGGGAAASVALPAPGQPLPGSIRLDDAPGPERIFVVLSAVPLSVADVRGVAVSQAAGQGVVERIAGAPVASAWIVLRKSRPGAARP